MMTVSKKLDWDKVNGLVPAIIQDAHDGRVLMLGYMNRAALERTLESGRITFFSRSKQRLWTKGETSGHVLDLVDIDCDCDRDTLLIQARPHGPTCHLGTTTCFGDSHRPAIGQLARLEQIIKARSRAGSESSYTRKLLDAGPERCAQKVGEEGVEVALAAATGNKDKLAEEAADLLYHLLVCLKSAGSSLDQVLEVLQARER
jgi:phosphoribosyl-AMP cyclohydrolase / phosphoribosyl-ATP pyrophosphohydrolase